MTQKPNPQPSPIGRYRAAVFQAEEEAEARYQRGEDASQVGAELAVAEGTAYGFYSELCLREARKLVLFWLFSLSALLVLL